MDAYFEWTTPAAIPLDRNGPETVGFEPFLKEWCERPAVELFATAAARYSDRVACEDIDTRLTFGEVWAAALRLAAIVDAAVPPGAPVGVLLPNQASYAVAVLACLGAARPCILIDRNYPQDRVGRIVRDAGLAAIVLRQSDIADGFLLPAGPLREPLSRRRDATLINDPYAKTLPPWPNTFALQLAPADAWHLDNPALRRPLAQFRGERVLAAAGIGAPERFFATLRAAGLAPETRALPDHYAFERNPFTGADADAILITEKDAVKLGSWRDARIWVVPVEAALDHRLIALVVEKIRGRSPA